jgi:hypothetical protein
VSRPAIENGVPIADRAAASNRGRGSPRSAKTLKGPRLRIAFDNTNANRSK